MNERRVPSFVLVVTFIFVLLAGTSEAGRRIAESFFGKNIQEIDEDTAEQLWVHCREELLEITDDFKYIDLYIPHTTSSSENKVNSDIGLLTKRIIHKAIIDLPPQVKHNLLDCLNEESSPSLYSGKESGLINWLNNWRELLSDWFSGPRRYLLRKSHPKNHKHKHTHKHKHKHKHRRGKHKAAPRPAEAPTPVSASPAFAPAPLYLVPASSPYLAEAPDFTASPNPAEAPDSTESPTPALVSPAFTPAPLYLVPASSPTPTVHSTVKVPEPSLPPVVKKSPPPLPAMRHPQPHAAPHKPSKSKGNSKESNTAIIGASSMAAFALIALFFCCCLRRRRNRIGPRDRQRDDKPLLNFCSSNHSAGSSQTSHDLENSSRKDFSSSSNVNNLPIRSGTALAEGKLLDAMKGASGDSHAPLPLPPGRTAPPHGISTAPPGKSAPPPPKPPPPPPPAPKAPASRAPPPPKVGHPPPPNPPKPGSSGRISLLGPHSRGRSSVGEETNKTSASDGQKAKLKPFFWDKVLAKPDQSMVWHDLKAGSFQFNEEMMENLFGYNTVEKNKNDRNCKRDPSTFEAPQYIQIIDTRKAQNLSILLRALNVTTEEVCEAVVEGNELPTELIQTLLKMAPTTEEELKLRLYSGDLSQLGPAERFLKVLVDIPFAFKRLESLLFMCSIQEEASTLKESFAVLEVACKELKNSRVFLKLLEAVLKTGNRMNDGTYRGGAQAFKLDTLLKLSDVKGIDGKTTLLHFVVLEIIRSEGIRAARRARENHSITSVKTEDLLEDSTQESSEYHRSLGLEVVSNLSNELANVRKAAAVDGDTITATVSRLGHSLKISKDFLNNEMNSLGDECEFRDTLASFVEQAEDDIIWILEEEKKITSLVKSTADYFHGTQGKDEGLRLFMIVRDFLVMVDKVCQEVKNSATNPIKIPKKEAPPSATSPSGESHQPPSPSVQRQRLFPAIKEQRKDDSSSDDESSSP